MSWQAVLEGRLKDRAQECVAAILDDLARLEPESMGDYSLAGGTAGLALLHGYLARTEQERDHAGIAVRCLNQATAAVAERAVEASLYSGLTGVGWTLAHLQGQLPGLDGEADLEAIDDLLLDHLGPSSWAGDYDLINGLVGFGVYSLERMPRHSAAAGLERVIDKLAQSAEPRSEGLTWWTNPAWLPLESREKSPNGYYNLGLAHGVPGVIALLGLVCAAGIACAEARSLLDKAVHWLLAQQNSGGFAHWVPPGIMDGPARLAWCYGDPGVAAALLGAARCVADPSWEREAMAIARRAAQRTPVLAGVRDASLCHGAAGLGHLFNRIFQATNEPQFGDAARYWFEQTLEMQRPGRGIGGYQAWQVGEGDVPVWVTDSGLLTGSVGIALAFLAATTAVEPAWDRVLLTAIPPSNER
jgi:lantibiotic modifying enzyme